MADALAREAGMNLEARFRVVVFFLMRSLSHERNSDKTRGVWQNKRHPDLAKYFARLKTKQAFPNATAFYSAKKKSHKVCKECM